MVYVENIENLLIQKNKKESFKLTVAPELFVTSDLEQIVEQIVTEDDTPVDNIFSEKQQCLLVEPLYSSWQAGRIFVATANVGLFSSPFDSPIVPDMLLSMDVEVAEEWYEKKHRSYFVWEFKKQPEVVVEIVSNKKGNEDSKKLLKYALIEVRYYVIYDPQKIIQDEKLKVFELSDDGEYILKPDNHLDKIGLSLTLWKGFFENKYAWWLRWCDMNGELIQTGFEWGGEGWEKARQEWERAEQEQKRAEQEWERAEQERERAEQERERAEQGWKKARQEQKRAEKLAAQLRKLGIEPEINKPKDEE